MNEQRRARLVAYGVAVLGAAGCLLARWLLWPVLENRHPYLTCLPAILISAYYGGLRPGLLAVLLGALGAQYFLMEPLHSFSLAKANVGLLYFLLVGTILGWNEALIRRRRAEEALRQANARVELAVQSSNIGIWECDMPDGRIENAHLTLVNMWESLGYDARTMPTDFSSACALFFHPDDLERVGREIQELLASDGQEWKNEYRALTKDGSTRWLLARGTVLREPDGKPVRFIGTSTDITDRKRAEEAVRQSEERFSRLARATNDAVWDWDLATNKVWWNEGVHTLFGYRLEEDSSDPAWWLERIHPEDRAAVETFFFEVVRGKELTWVDEYRFRCADRSYRNVYDRGYVLRNADGQATRMIGAMLDITDRKRAEEALRESEQRWRSLAEALPQLVWTDTPDGYCDYLSSQWEKYTGVPAAEHIGWRWMEAIHPDDRERVRHRWTEAVASGGDYDVEFRIRRADGEYRWFKTRGVPLRDSAGNIFKWFGTCTDITTIKQFEEEMRQAKEAAEAANRAKDDFLANVSHEIRTPMNAILGMTELVLDTPLDEDQRQGLKTVKSAADSLLGIINDLLDFSKIEAGKLELDVADFSLRGAVGDTLRALAVRAHKKGLELIYQVQPDVPDALIGDAGRLRQVLLNLAGNAVKFTDEGEVVVKVSRQSAVGSRQSERPGETAEALAAVDCLLPTADCLLAFEVRDTGIGIPPDQQQRIFRAFEQEDTSTTRKYGGTGLGLTIASRLVALMGGTITVDSAPGRGSTFAFTARFSQQPHPAEPVSTPPPVSLHDLPVLVVDDNGTNRHILAEWLRGWQMKPAAVGDGMAAMDALWHRTAKGRPYALVLLDARMPDADGLAVAAMIRERAELAATRIILLTSGERPGDPARVRELRIDAQLLKPVQQDELLETIYRVMSRTEAVGSGQWTVGREEEPALASVPTALHILVAEDNEFNAQLLEHVLGRRGCRVRLAENGREALRLVGEGDFDLLLLDVHMPELDGFQVAQAIRERERTTGGHLPIIALTARSRREDRERCLAAGMDEFLAKPIQAADLWAAMDRVVGGRPGADRPGPGLLDQRVLLAACGEDAATLVKLGQTFRTRVPVHLKAVQDALRDEDAPRLREAAHKLAGMIATFSTAAGSVASDLEDRADQGQLEEARPLVERLETMAEELMRLVAGLSLETLR